MVLANFLVRIEIPDWMNESEQDAMLAALDKCNFKKSLAGSAAQGAPQNQALEPE